MSLRTLRQGAFENCSRLKRAVLNEGLEALGTDEYSKAGSWNGVFESSTLEHVELPSTLKRIEYSAFRDCEGLRSVVLPDGLEVIGRRAFRDTGLTQVRLPRSLRDVQVGAFYLSPLASVVCESGQVSVWDHAFGETGLKVGDVAFPAGAHVSALTFGGAEGE